jgi:hypothetical protein
MQRINKFPNPRFSLTGTSPAWNASTMLHDELNGIPRLAVKASTNGKIYMWPVKLDPGDYHFQVVTWHETPCGGCILWASADGNKASNVVYSDGTKDARNAVTQSADFTMTSENPWLMISFCTCETGTVGQAYAYYAQPLLELKSTYDAAVNAGGVFPCTSTARPCQRSTSLQPGFEVVA